MGSNEDETPLLNVILHGLFAFDQQKDKIVAHIPNMGSEHQYKAGNWLAETNLEEHAELALEGVQPNERTKDNQLNPKHNIIFKDTVFSENAHKCHCIHATLRLPYPIAIKSLRRTRVPADLLGGETSASLAKDLECATVQVLTYKIEDGDDNLLKLGDHPWEPVLADGFVNLHVYSEPERSPTDDHLRHAFQACTDLFMGVDLVLKGPLQASPPEEPVCGVHEFELQDMVQRQRWLAVLGRRIKQGRDIQTIWDDPTPFAGSDACTAGGGTCYGC
jgi:hypothetical protein